MFRTQDIIEEKVMRTRTVVGIVVGFHLVIAGAVVLVPGCQTGPQVVPTRIGDGMPPRERGTTRPVVRRAVRLRGAALASHRPAPASRMSIYTVKAGEVLSVIAGNHGLTTKELADLNDLADPNKLVIGQELLLSAGAKLRTRARPKARRSVSRRTTRPSVVAPAGMAIYQVRKKDCLSKIAVKHGMTLKALRNANELTGDRIDVGQKLIVAIRGEVDWAPDPPANTESGPEPEPEPDVAPDPVPAPPPELPDRVIDDVSSDARASADVAPLPIPAHVDESFGIHEVRVGETLDDIAGMYAVSVVRLMAANNLKNKRVSPGTPLKIPQNN